MEKDLNKNKGVIELPAGFRFHPSDEELITHYLSPKVLDSSFNTIAIGDVDLNKVEPWDLPWKAKIGEKEWYFFCLRDRKYPTGLRTNRATVAGYWKATGKDKDIHRSKTLIGMKKTLVFYRGRAPRGEKTDWVMHEYRLHGEDSMQNLTKSSKNEWVICRVFKKISGGKKADISGLIDYRNNEDSRTGLSSEECNPRTSFSSNLTCFSNTKGDDPRKQEFSCEDLVQFPFMLPEISTTHSRSDVDNLSCQKQSTVGILQENNGSSIKQTRDSVFMHEVGFKYWDDLDCLWNY